MSAATEKEAMMEVVDSILQEIMDIQKTIKFTWKCGRFGCILQLSLLSDFVIN